MMGKLKILILVGVGYVLGARAGRERYEQIRDRAKRFANNPKVQDTVSKAEETVRHQAPVVKDKVSDAANAAAAKVSRNGDDDSGDFPADPGRPGAPS
ncbi:hypothetical protein [Nocardioides donggukensis]|uniref:YtxH domain-containing protein n=1 Tax=Nocardioides donggukensis TaxID=2774019 RepID=A0A927K9X4_9ACTN|nr:hypothetical protein [Nocardioides donggukensis]MBD8870461.1 hypothetical protein [Nocardioides donggukensis]